jgi:hypothetical protein
MENRNILILILIAITAMAGGVLIYLGLSNTNPTSNETVTDTDSVVEDSAGDDIFVPVADDAGTSSSCPYVLTKFGAQENISSPWSQNLTVDLDDTSSIRITAFQCTEAQGAACDSVATNARISLSGAGISQTYTINGAGSIPTVPLVTDGTIIASVTTPGYSDPGQGCNAGGSIVVEPKEEIVQSPTPDPVVQSTNSVCGDGVCSADENATICSADCTTTTVTAAIPATGVSDFITDYGYFISGGILIFFGFWYLKVRRRKSV